MRRTQLITTAGYASEHPHPSAHYFFSRAHDFFFAHYFFSLAHYFFSRAHYFFARAHSLFRARAFLFVFRNIRKSLIDSGSAPKYLLYAIGEVALVVFGILIAFQINNWNDWRKDRIEEVEILTDLKESIEALTKHVIESVGITRRTL